MTGAVVRVVVGGASVVVVSSSQEVVGRAFVEVGVGTDDSSHSLVEAVMMGVVVGRAWLVVAGPVVWVAV